MIITQLDRAKFLCGDLPRLENNFSKGLKLLRYGLILNFFIFHVDRESSTEQPNFLLNYLSSK